MATKSVNVDEQAWANFGSIVGKNNVSKAISALVNSVNSGWLQVREDFSLSAPEPFHLYPDGSPVEEFEAVVQTTLPLAIAPAPNPNGQSLLESSVMTRALQLQQTLIQELKGVIGDLKVEVERLSNPFGQLQNTTLEQPAVSEPTTPLVSTLPGAVKATVAAPETAMRVEAELVPVSRQELEALQAEEISYQSIEWAVTRNMLREVVVDPYGVPDLPCSTASLLNRDLLEVLDHSDPADETVQRAVAIAQAGFTASRADPHYQLNPKDYSFVFEVAGAIAQSL